MGDSGTGRIVGVGFLLVAGPTIIGATAYRPRRHDHEDATKEV